MLSVAKWWLNILIYSYLIAWLMLGLQFIWRAKAHGWKIGLDYNSIGEGPLELALISILTPLALFKLLPMFKRDIE